MELPVGLFNHGYTCYINALLQHLFLTPEFCELLHKWPFDDIGLLSKHDIALSLPHQLKTLCSRLQNNRGELIGTMELLRSLDISPGIDFAQDLQDFRLSLFSKLERCKISVRDVYQIQWKSFALCHSCGHQSLSVSDASLDIPLHTHKAANIEQALHNFVSPEILSGWACGQCTKCDTTTKYKKIVEFPKVLTLKLEHEMHQKENVHGVEYEVTIPFYFENSFFCTEVKHGTIPFVYELVCIIFYESRHYYSYIKVAQGRWFKFDDKDVSQVLLIDLHNIVQKNCSKIYMLMYHQAATPPAPPEPPRPTLSLPMSPRIPLTTSPSTPFMPLIAPLSLTPSSSFSQFLSNSLETSLFLAAADGHTHVVQQVLHWGVRPGVCYARKQLNTWEIALGSDDAITGDDITPIYIASWKGRLEVVQQLVAHGAGVNVATSVGDTPLHCACLHGHVEVVKFLMKCGAAVDVATHTGDTPLHCAALNGHLEIVKHLVEFGAPLDAVTDSGITPLSSACYFGHVEVVRFLVKREAEVNSTANDGTTILHYASLRGHLEIVQVLVAGGADVNAAALDGGTPLQHASLNGHLEVVKYLVRNGARLESVVNTGVTPLHDASSNGHLEVVKHLIESGAEINRSTSDGGTPLHYAASNGRLEVVKYLIRCGEKVTAKRNDGGTPLHYASSNGHVDVVDYLVQYGAKVTAVRNDGGTPLHSAASNGQMEVVKYLVVRGANVNAGKSDGFTPLHNAASYGHLEVVRFLLEKGAKVNAVDKSGITALRWALDLGHDEVVQYLRKCGAKDARKGLFDLFA